MIWDFQTKLEASRQGMTAAPLIQAWLVGCVRVDQAGVADDKNGIDYWATLRNGARVGIDHKLREKGAARYWRWGVPELAMEVWSVKPTPGRPGKTGWTLDESKNTDYVLYSFHDEDSDSAYLLPFQLLRLAFRLHCADWLKEYHAKDQDSGGWKSQAIFVPAPVVLTAVQDQMELHVTAGAISRCIESY